MLINFREVRQTEEAECGLVCLAIASGLLGAEVELADLRQKHPVSSRGLTLKEIAEIASAMGMTSRAVRCEIEEVEDLASPAILHWGLDHFVVLESCRRRVFHIIDPAEGPRIVKAKELSRLFTGVALELSTAPAFQKRRERSPLRLSSLFRWTPQISTGLTQALLLSLLLQIHVIISPFYLQLSIDEAALKSDRDLLVTLAVGFGMFAVFNAGAEALRGIALQRASSLLGWDMTRRLFHHLVRLPLPWFQRRRLADALTRFDSLAPVRNLIANGLIAALIDGVLSVTTVIMMVIFSSSLAAVTVGGLVLYAVVRVVLIPITLRVGMAMLTASIAEQGKRIETLRAIQTIKLMGAEARRESDWANKFSETIRTSQSNAIINVAISSIQKLTESVTLVIVVYIGVVSIIEERMTIGVLYAFIAYRTQFLARAQNLLEQAINWRLLDLHTYRLADIVLHPTEPGVDRSLAGPQAILGKIELANIGFSYAPHEPYVIRGINLTIERGEFVAIVGPSGGGKSTLLKVICGLYPPNAGEVRFDGAPQSSWGAKVIRQSLGVVMQDDELLSGSIAENVAFFDERIDMEKVWHCLTLSAIDEDVRMMPMRTDTLVGDLGSSLSAGQKQRILLARALYRDPTILILDEATSYLDIPRERTINEALRALPMTRLIVAHRPETVAAAGRVIVLSGGQITLDQVNPRVADTAVK